MNSVPSNSKQVRFQEILKELAALKLSEMEQFMKEAAKLFEKMKLPEYSDREIELIDKIKNGGPSKEIFNRHDELLKKSLRGTMTEEENREALELIPIFDKWTVERLKLMIELSNLWNTSVDEVMNRLKIQTPPTIYAE